MADQGNHAPAGPLRIFELRLLSCTLPPSSSSAVDSSAPPPPPPPVPSSKYETMLCSHHHHNMHLLIENVLTLIESGHYLRALSSDASRLIFNFDLFKEASFQDYSANQFYSEFIINCATSFIIGDGDNVEEKSYRALLVMMIAVAAFLSFTQSNFTGPVESLAVMPLMGALELREEGGSGGGWAEWEAWARSELMLAGSHLHGKFSNLQYIVFAKILLMRMRDLSLEGSFVTIYENRSISWWLARLIFRQQKMLDENSSSLFAKLKVFMSESLHHFDTLEKVQNYWGAKLQSQEALAMVSMLHLEVGTMELAYGRVDFARVHIQTAELASSLQVSLSGVLGYRTVHQVEPKAQLLLVAGTSAINGSDICSSVDINLSQNVSTLGKDCLLGQDREISEVSDVLMIPRFVETNKNSEIRAEGGKNGRVSSLTTVQQALLLAQCISIEKNSRQDDMQRWEMAPYIEAIDSQQSSCFIIQFFCDLLRIRWESNRSRTKERALLMMEKLIQRIGEPFPGVAERIYACYGVQVPGILELRREYGDLLVRCGLIGEAVRVYEDLELWDKVIVCYSLLEKKAAAVELIKRRLSESPNDPRLWCFLGDVTNDDSCYRKALEVSENKSVRAKRSLARSACKKGEYEMSKILWESAMASNSLYPDGWFALGYVALKTRDFDTSLDAFKRAVQLDPENGDAWANIASLHMMKNKNKEAFIALKEALKFKRNSWKLWENYSHVAADINNFGQAMEAVKKVLVMTDNKRINYAILERVMQEIEGQFKSSMTTDNNHDNCDICDKYDDGNDGQLTCSDVGLARPHGDGLLMELLGNVLQQMENSGGGAETLGLCARWYKVKGDLTMCAEKLVKQVRAYQGTNLWHDGDRFKKFVQASLELCELYMELSSRTGKREELTKAEKHLNYTIKQAEHFSFSETEELRGLKACLDNVQTRLQTSLVPAS